MPDTVTPVFSYELVTKNGQRKNVLGTIDSPEPLGFDSVIKWSTPEGPVLYRVNAVSISEDKSGTKRTATAVAIIAPGTKIVAVDFAEAKAEDTATETDEDNDSEDDSPAVVAPSRRRAAAA